MPRSLARGWIILLKLINRAYQTEADFWRIRDFLRQVMLLNGLRERSWHVARWDYWRWHGVENMGEGPLEQTVFLWETPEGEIAAVLNPEGRGDAFLQIHPAQRTLALERAMLDLAEERLSVEGGGRRRLGVWAHADDPLRREELLRRGYSQGVEAEAQRRRTLDGEIPVVFLPAGYRLRSLGEEPELPARSWASWRAFHPSAPDSEYEGREWYRNIQRAPLYRRDLDLVAVAPDGEIAGFCTLWYDDYTRSGSYEPVGVRPEHQRRGLGKALMLEGLRRLQRLGATNAFVSSYEPAAHALYASAGFAEFDLYQAWVKLFHP
jgi:ribosomal protein S18 acetylase RimI-like enzyme